MADITPQIDLDEFDRHIANVQSQIVFLASWLDTVHNEDDDWLATELITLKGGTSMLCDKWRHLRKRVCAEGRVIKGAKSRESTTRSEKRLSIEGVAGLNMDSRRGSGSRSASRNGTPLKESTSASGSAGKEERRTRKRARGTRELTPPVQHTQQQQVGSESGPGAGQQRQSEGINGNANGNDSPYQVQYVDVTDIVNKRLRESRLRQLMEPAPRSQKRKRGDLEEEGASDGGDGEGDMGELEDAEDALASMMSPTKKIKTFGEFTQVVRTDEGAVKKRLFFADDSEQNAGAEEGREEGRPGAKRRRKG